MSTELKKGDLVMTEHGFAWYESPKDEFSPDWSVALVYGLNAPKVKANTGDVRQATKVTREQVEAYLKEKGWVCSDLDWFSKEGQQWYIWYSNRLKCYTLKLETDQLIPEQFDTAPEQLSEAILMAKLLNATKD